MESHLRLVFGVDLFVAAQDTLEVPQGTTKVTVLIETIMAALLRWMKSVRTSQPYCGTQCRSLGVISLVVSEISSICRLPSSRSRSGNDAVPSMRAYAKGISANLS